MKAIIIGFMGSGKTTVSRLLAQKLGCRAFDLDEYIVENERRSVKQIFEEDGEDYFRKREHELLLEILKEDAVLATGGGTPLREDNRMAMKNAGVPVILLEASSKKTFERLQGDDTRPLAANCSKMREKSSAFSLIWELSRTKIRKKLQNGIANLMSWLYNLKQS